METGIAKAIRLAGSQTALGNMLGLTPQAIQKWAAAGVVPGDRCREVEAALSGQVTRYELNADVFGDPPTTSDPAPAPRRRKTDADATTSDSRQFP